MPEEVRNIRHLERKLTRKDKHCLKFKQIKFILFVERFLDALKPLFALMASR